jgi:hypothetical protein
VRQPQHGVLDCRVHINNGAFPNLTVEIQPDVESGDENERRGEQRTVP